MSEYAERSARMRKLEAAGAIARKEIFGFPEKSGRKASVVV